MKPFQFVCDGGVYSGQIVKRIGEALIIEGMAADSGLFFLKADDSFRRFDTRKEVEDYAEELAQDRAQEAGNPLDSYQKTKEEKSEPWKLPVEELEKRYPYSAVLKKPPGKDASPEEEEYNRELKERLRNTSKGGQLPPPKRTDSEARDAPEGWFKAGNVGRYEVLTNAQGEWLVKNNEARKFKSREEAEAFTHQHSNDAKTRMGPYGEEVVADPEEVKKAWQNIVMAHRNDPRDPRDYYKSGEGAVLSGPHWK